MSDSENLTGLSTEDPEVIIANGLSQLKANIARLRELINVSRCRSQHIPDDLEAFLRCAEATIEDINKKLGFGPQYFDAVTRENIESEDGLDLPAKNKKLYEKVTRLKEYIRQCGNHIREMEAALASNKNELTSNEVELERSMNENNESLLKENMNPTNRLEHGKHQPTERKDTSDGQTVENKRLNDSIQEYESIKRENQSHIEVIRRLESEIKDLNETVAVQQSEIMEHESSVKELARIITNLLAKEKEINIFCEMLLDSRRKLLRLFEIHEPGNPLPELDQGDSNEPIQERERLRRENQINMATIRRLESEVDEFRAKVAEKDAMMAIMIDNLKSYIADFKSENKEKKDIQKRMHESSQKCERLGRENKSLMAKIRDLEREIEMMNQLLNEKNKDRARVN